MPDRLNAPSLIHVASTHGGAATGLALSRLAGAGVPVAVVDFHTSDVLSYASFATGGARICVPRSRVAEAHALLSALDWVSTPIRGVRMLIWLVFLFWSTVPCSPSAVFVSPNLVATQRSGEKTA